MTFCFVISYTDGSKLGLGTGLAGQNGEIRTDTLAICAASPSALLVTFFVCWCLWQHLSLLLFLRVRHRPLSIFFANHNNQNNSDRIFNCVLKSYSNTITSASPFIEYAVRWFFKNCQFIK